MKTPKNHACNMDGEVDREAWTQAKKELGITPGTNLTTMDIQRITKRAQEIKEQLKIRRSLGANLADRLAAIEYAQQDEDEKIGAIR